MRCAVCRCLRGACWSARRISSMNSFTGSSLGCDRSGTLRSGGTALAIACRTIRRCTPNCFATPRIVPTPKRYSRLICSNSSTLRLLSVDRPIFLRSNYQNASCRIRRSNVCIRGALHVGGIIEFEAEKPQLFANRIAHLGRVLPDTGREYQHVNASQDSNHCANTCLQTVHIDVECQLCP